MALSLANPMIAMSLLTPEPAFAKGGEYGALECVPEALIHPAIMLIILGTSLTTAYYGYQYRVLRTKQGLMGDIELEKLKEIGKMKPK